jgi:hypothetical protein
MTAEDLRLQEAREHKVPWREWGPYLSELQRPGLVVAKIIPDIATGGIRL